VSRVRAGVLISERRWNIVLAEAVEIMLPEKDPAAALARVAEIDEESGLLSRDIAAVDLRLPDKLVVRLSETAFTARQETIKEREKAAHKMGTDT
jgi:cell division protein FtsQ